MHFDLNTVQCRDFSLREIAKYAHSTASNLIDRFCTHSKQYMRHACNIDAIININDGDHGSFSVWDDCLWNEIDA